MRNSRPYNHFVRNELTFEVADDELNAMKEMVARLMCEVPQKALNFKVPLAVDVGVGSNWDNAKGDE